MASKLLIAACIVTLLLTTASEATITCGQVVGALAPCVPYVQKGGPPNPPAGCCNGIRAVNSQAKSTPDRQAACNCIKTAAKSISEINSGALAGLPGKCGVNIPYKISTSTDCSKVK